MKIKVRHRRIRCLLTGLLFLTFFTLSFVPQVSAAGAKPEDGASLKLDGEYFKGYLTDSKSILTSPMRFERNDWLKTSLIFAGGLTLYLFDENIKDWTQEQRDSTTDNISTFAEHMGDGKYLLAGLGGFYLLSEVTDDLKAKRTALLGLESFVISGLFTQVVKFSFHRHRPKSGDPYDTWDGPSTSSDNLSFSSGHSAVAWSVATVIATEYRDTPFVAPISYALATLASLSRVHDNKHWASDVFIGAALGYFTSKAIISYHQNDRAKDVSIVPIIGNDSLSLVARYNF
jgi:hypothetical protein